MAPSPAATPAAEPAGVRTRQLYLTAAIMLLAIWMAWPFLIPIIWAAVLALAEWPLYTRALKRFRVRPGLLALGFTLATALFVIVPLSLTALSLARESQGALAWLRHVQQAGLPAPSWIGGLPLGARIADWWQHNLADPHGASALLGSLSAGSLLDWTRSVGGAVAQQSTLFVITLIALATLLARGATIDVQTHVVAERMFGTFGRRFLDRMGAAVRGTVNGTVLVSVAEGAAIGIGYVVAGVPQPLLFAVLTMVLALIPFAAVLAVTLAAAILVVQGHVLAAALLLGFGVAVMLVGDNAVKPSVVGSAVELPFLLAMVGALGGLAELGLIGLFVGPVIMAALLLVWREWMDPAAAPPRPRRRPRAG